MSHIRTQDTEPEILLRHKLWHLGFRYRINVKALPGKPDIVLKKYNTVIFVNGCFWHGHDGCRFFVIPETNREFWAIKINANRERDARQNELLKSTGWNVITIWECELKKQNISDTIEKLISAITQTQYINQSSG